MQMDGFRQQSAVQMGQIYAKANYRFNANSSIRFILNYSNSPKAEDPGSLNAEQVAEDREQARDRNLFFNGGEEITQTRLGLVFNQKINKGGLVIKAFTTSRDFSNRLPFENGGIVQFERQFHGAGLKYSTPTTFGKVRGKFVLGSDISIQSDDRRRYNNLEGILGDLSFDQEERFQSIGVCSEACVLFPFVRPQQTGCFLQSKIRLFLFDNDPDYPRTLSCPWFCTNMFVHRFASDIH